MLRDIVPGSGSSSPAYFTVAGDYLFFSAYDAAHDVELWRTDGTEAGTVLVRDIHTTGDSSPADLVAVGPVLFIKATTAAQGQELWNSDGTEGGTVLVKDIRPGADPSGIISPTAFNGQLFFGADNGVNGAELWKSDGTAEGTVLVKDLNSGGGSGVDALCAAGNLLFFQAGNLFSGIELCKSDGTTAGTVLVRDMAPGGSSGMQGSMFQVSGNRLFFDASVPDASSKRHGQLWKIDGDFSAVGDDAGSGPRVVLAPTRPNPFRSSTWIRHEIPEDGAVTVQILDVRGGLVRVLRDDVPEPPGDHAVAWDGRDARGREGSFGNVLLPGARGGAGTRPGGVRASVRELRPSRPRGGGDGTVPLANQRNESRVDHYPTGLPARAFRPDAGSVPPGAGDAFPGGPLRSSLERRTGKPPDSRLMRLVQAPASTDGSATAAAVPGGPITTAARHHDRFTASSSRRRCMELP